MKIKINLVKVIEQAAPQVWGSDEREILYTWLARNTEPTQEVEVDLPARTIKQALAESKRTAKE
jgi:hypothetical protein